MALNFHVARGGEPVTIGSTSPLLNGTIMTQFCHWGLFPSSGLSLGSSFTYSLLGVFLKSPVLYI